MRPLIGATDFTEFWQAQHISGVFEKHKKPGSQRLPHIGVMMSHKTLRGLESRFTDVFPKKERLASIFSSPHVYNCLHFANYENSNGLCSDLLFATRYCGNQLHAVQLDMIWPCPDELRTFKRLYGLVTSGRERKLEIILQVGRRAFEKISNDPCQLVEKLKDYEGLIDRVLLDKSGGEGIPMKANELLPFAHEIKHHFPRMGLIFAGGLGPDTLHFVEPALKEFPDASIDAQLQLKQVPNPNRYAPFALKRVENYFIKALALFD